MFGDNHYNPNMVKNSHKILHQYYKDIKMQFPTIFVDVWADLLAEKALKHKTQEREISF